MQSQIKRQRSEVVCSQLNHVTEKLCNAEKKELEVGKRDKHSNVSTKRVAAVKKARSQQKLRSRSIISQTPPRTRPKWWEEK
jgi:hypothetical protein